MSAPSQPTAEENTLNTSTTPQRLSVTYNYSTMHWWIWVGATFAAVAHAIYWCFAKDKISLIVRVFALLIAFFFGPMYWVFWAGLHLGDYGQTKPTSKKASAKRAGNQNSLSTPAMAYKLD